MLAPWKKSYDQPRQHIKNQKHYFPDKGLSSQSYGFSSSQVRMWELDHKKGWAPKNWCFWTVVMENMHESPLDCKEIQPVNCKGNQTWVFIERTDAEGDAPIPMPPDVRSQLIRKDPGGKDWRQERWGQQRRRWLVDITNSMDMSLSKLQEMIKERETCRAQVHGVTKSRTWLSDWTIIMPKRSRPQGEGS